MRLTMDLLPVALAAVLGLALVLLLLSRQQAAYKKHVAQLQPKPKKTKVFNIYTREEVAKHGTRTDAWVVIKHK
jgi:hypothetical protein